MFAKFCRKIFVANHDNWLFHRELRLRLRGVCPAAQGETRILGKAKLQSGGPEPIGTGTKPVIESLPSSWKTLFSGRAVEQIFFYLAAKSGINPVSENYPLCRGYVVIP